MVKLSFIRLFYLVFLFYTIKTFTKVQLMEVNKYVNNSIVFLQQRLVVAQRWITGIEWDIGL